MQNLFLSLKTKHHKRLLHNFSIIQTPLITVSIQQRCSSTFSFPSIKFKINSSPHLPYPDGSTTIFYQLRRRHRPVLCQAAYAPWRRIGHALHFYALVSPAVCASREYCTRAASVFGRDWRLSVSLFHTDEFTTRVVHSLSPIRRISLKNQELIAIGRVIFARGTGISGSGIVIEIYNAIDRFDGWLRKDNIEERILELYIFKRSCNSSLNFLIDDNVLWKNSEAIIYGKFI